MLTIRGLALAALKLGSALLLLLGVVLLWNFPYAVDAPARREEEIQSFYELVYATDTGKNTERDEAFARVCRQARTASGLYDLVTEFARTYALDTARVLEVGSGDGFLQDIVADYTGLDIAAAAARHYHKPFVHGTATAMPFRDGEFDALWSIWVLEHIPNPEAALVEMRRVIRPGGVLFLMPAWEVAPWAADGLSVRPYEDLGWIDRLRKASIGVRASVPAWLLRKVPVRTVRSLASSFGPTRLRYQRVDANFDDYWEPDSDAVSRVDAMEAAMWFESRGDTCLNCASMPLRLIDPDHPIVIRRGHRP